MPFQPTASDIDAAGRWDDDSPPDKGGAVDDGLPAAKFIEQMERARSRRVKEILNRIGRDSSDVPDRLIEGFASATQNAVWNAAPSRRGRKPGSSNFRNGHIVNGAIPQAKGSQHKDDAAD